MATRGHSAWPEMEMRLYTRPHPGPLPPERVNRHPALSDTNTLSFRHDFGAMSNNAVTATMAAKLTSDCHWLSRSREERAGVRASVHQTLPVSPFRRKHRET